MRRSAALFALAVLLIGAGAVPAGAGPRVRGEDHFLAVWGRAVSLVEAWLGIPTRWFSLPEKAGSQMDPDGTAGTPPGNGATSIGSEDS